MYYQIRLFFIAFFELLCRKENIMHCQDLKKLLKHVQNYSGETVVLDRLTAIKILTDALRERRRAGLVIRKIVESK
jgi:hypothetical protein